MEKPETSKQIISKIEKIIPDAKVDALGNVQKQFLENNGMATFRMNLINRIICIHDKTKNIHLRVANQFCIDFSSRLEKGEEVNVEKLWLDSIKEVKLPDAQIDWQSLMPKANGIGTPTPKCSAQGFVVKKEDLDKE